MYQEQRNLKQKLLQKLVGFWVCLFLWVGWLVVCGGFCRGIFCLFLVWLCLFVVLFVFPLEMQWFWGTVYLLSVFRLSSCLSSELQGKYINKYAQCPFWLSPYPKDPNCPPKCTKPPSTANKNLPYDKVVLTSGFMFCRALDAAVTTGTFWALKMLWRSITLFWVHGWQFQFLFTVASGWGMVPGKKATHFTGDLLLALSLQTGELAKGRGQMSADIIVTMLTAWSWFIKRWSPFVLLRIYFYFLCSFERLTANHYYIVLKKYRVICSLIKRHCSCPEIPNIKQKLQMQSTTKRWQQQEINGNPLHSQAGSAQVCTPVYNTKPGWMSQGRTAKKLC